MKGKSHFLVRMPKVTKDKQKIQALEEEKKECKSMVRSLVEEIKDLRNKIQQLEESQQENDDNLEKLSNLYELDVIDENGQPLEDRME